MKKAQSSTKTPESSCAGKTRELKTLKVQLQCEMHLLLLWKGNS